MDASPAFFSYCCINAFNLTFTGTVLDKNTNNPVCNASVYINGTFVGTGTDVQGKFTLNIPDNLNK